MWITGGAVAAVVAAATAVGTMTAGQSSPASVPPRTAAVTSAYQGQPGHPGEEDGDDVVEGHERRQRRFYVNGYLKSTGYKLTITKDVAGNPTVLMNRASYDVGVLHRAPTIGVWMEKPPWNKGKVKGTKIGHAILVYGYDKAKGTITVFDP
jgi:hypothetical protein